MRHWNRLKNEDTSADKNKRVTFYNSYLTIFKAEKKMQLTQLPGLCYNFG